MLASRSSPDADDLEARLTELDLAPPPLCHQRSQEWAEPVYRSASIDPSRLSLERRSTSFEEYEEEPVYRSAFSGLHLDASAISDDDPYYTDERFHADWGFVRVDDPRHSRIGCCSPTHGLSAVGCPATTPDAAFVFDLPCEIFDHVLAFLPCHPDLFNAMAASKSWRRCASDNCARRCVDVPASQGGLTRAVEAARPGDTLRLSAGLHVLSAELTLSVPLQLVGPPAGAGGADAAPAVLSSAQHVLLRSRSAARLRGLTLCRMGEGVGYPNAVLFAEAGTLSVEACRITCGGGARDEADALRAFAGAPTPGVPFEQRPQLPAEASLPAAPPHERLQADAALSSDAGGNELPQSGVWVGAAARVLLRGCLISRTLGPGVKVYRGELEAVGNTIAFASRGANVVANGGRVRLSRNQIQGATGDGVSVWNCTQLSADGNRIEGNTGSGVVINSCGGRVSLGPDNEFAANGAQDISRPSARELACSRAAAAALAAGVPALALLHRCRPRLAGAGAGACPLCRSAGGAATPWRGGPWHGVAAAGAASLAEGGCAAGRHARAGGAAHAAPTQRAVRGRAECGDGRAPARLALLSRRGYRPRGFGVGVAWRVRPQAKAQARRRSDEQPACSACVSPQAMCECCGSDQC
mmetsp:Transcript_20418/g.62315  ORF Transcript_20418/g.62315 Transcript_20418/m.62315 type:complete len:642 (+) Transcript_20418:68-1993(+)